jgi:hypothetical protein
MAQGYIDEQGQSARRDSMSLKTDETLAAKRYICLALEAAEIIELKQAMLDRDVQGAADLFRRAVAPRVQAAAQRRGIALEEAEDNDGRLPR